MVRQYIVFTCLQSVVYRWRLTSAALQAVLLNECQRVVQVEMMQVEVDAMQAEADSARAAAEAGQAAVTEVERLAQDNALLAARLTQMDTDLQVLTCASAQETDHARDQKLGDLASMSASARDCFCTLQKQHRSIGTCWLAKACNFFFLLFFFFFIAPGQVEVWSQLVADLCCRAGAFVACQANL